MVLVNDREHSVNMQGSFKRGDKQYTKKSDLINTFNVRQRRGITNVHADER